MPLNPVGICHICKARHDNIGYQPSRSYPLKWYCRECSHFMKEAVAMPKKQFDAYETAAVQEASVEAGQYLDAINQTDLAELDEIQFLTFFTTFMTAYGKSMKTVFERQAGA